MKRYVRESGSSAVNALLPAGPVFTSRLSAAEIASALARRHREGHLKKADRDRLVKAMEDDMTSFYLVEVSPEVSALACRLLMNHRLRAADALHLASAVLLGRRTGSGCQFIAFDDTLNAAAQQEGLWLRWPENHPEDR